MWDTRTVLIFEGRVKRARVSILERLAIEGGKFSVTGSIQVETGQLFTNCFGCFEFGEK